MGKKVISFSLWGNKPMYTFGALENIRLAKSIYPDWRCRFYVDDSVENRIIRSILLAGGDVFKISDNRGPFWGMFWRFMANDDPDVDMFISRDCDSRLSNREKACVDEWIESDKCFHTIHDNKGHISVPILGGMWGAKKGCIKDITSKIVNWGRYEAKGIDQFFLRNVIWDEVRDRTMNHSSLYHIWANSIPFPAYEDSEIKVNYVGEIYDENNNSVIP